MQRNHPYVPNFQGKHGILILFSHSMSMFSVPWHISTSHIFCVGQFLPTWLNITLFIPLPHSYQILTFTWTLQYNLPSFSLSTRNKPIPSLRYIHSFMNTLFALRFIKITIYIFKLYLFIIYIEICLFYQ